MKVANEFTYQGIEMMLEGLLLHSYLSSAHMLVSPISAISPSTSSTTHHSNAMQSSPLPLYIPDLQKHKTVDQASKAIVIILQVSHPKSMQPSQLMSDPIPNTKRLHQIEINARDSKHETSPASYSATRGQESSSAAVKRKHVPKK